MVRVVNVRGLSGAAREGVVYCGRPFAGWKGHPLANLYRLDDPRWGGSREEVLSLYRTWLMARPTLEADLAALWEESGHGEKPLGCWCKPLSCHCDVLADLLNERFTTPKET